MKSTKFYGVANLHEVISEQVVGTEETYSHYHTACQDLAQASEYRRRAAKLEARARKVLARRRARLQAKEQKDATKDGEG